MSFQRCPNCQKRNDVSVYVHGQLARCVQCGIRFTVNRESLERLGSAPRAEGMTDAASTGLGGHSGVAAPAVEPAPRPTLSLAPPPEPQQETAAQRKPEPAKADNRPVVPGYDVLELLGRGGMGEVWKARQLSLKRPVAIKVLSEELAKEPDFVRRFERESSALAALAHPHVVQVFDRGHANGKWYFTMEFVEGRSLRDKHAEKPLTRAELLRLVAQVARAIDYAHQKGVIHRDLKPENVLVDHQGNAKVADFGLAGMAEEGRSSLTMTAVAMGTAHYMAPEQRKDAKNVDGRADLYSLGVMLYELLTGELPVGRFKTPREKLPDLDARLDDMILKLLDQDPARRPRRALDVAALLDSLVLGPRNVSHVPAPPMRRQGGLASTVREVRSSRARLAMFAAAALLLVTVLAVALMKSHEEPFDPRLRAKIQQLSSSSVAISYGEGIEGAVVTEQRGWKTTADGGLSRDGLSSRAQPRRTESEDSVAAPRAMLETLRADLDNAQVEAEVVLNQGRGSKTPVVAELLLLKDDATYVGLRLRLGEGVRHELLASTPKAPLRAIAAEVETDRKGGESHRVALGVVSGKLTAFIDSKPLGSMAVAGLSGEKARFAFACGGGGSCALSNVRIRGALSDAAPKPVQAAP